MARFMLDTDVCIYVMKNQPERLIERFTRLAPHLSVSSVSLAELYAGAEKSRRREANIEAIEQFIARIEVLAFGADAARHYGEIRASLESAGQPAGAFDMLIGGHARAENLAVVTNNTREFERMPGVRVENWL